MSIKEDIKNKLEIIQYDESTDDFERAVDKVAIEAVNKYDSIQSQEFESYLVKVLEDGDVDKLQDDIFGFKALFCLHIFYRHKYKNNRKEYRVKLEEIINEQRAKRFKAFTSISHLNLNAKLVLDTLDKATIKKAVNEAENNPEHSGRMHVVATIILRYYEKNSNIQNIKEYDEDLETAMEYIDKSIKKRDFSKSYHTKARILEKQAVRLIEKDKMSDALKVFDNAIKEVSRALDMEDATNIVRMSSYNKYMLDLYEKKQKYNAEKIENEMEGKAKETAARSYQILGTFIGLSTLLTSSINFLGKMEPKDALILLVGLFGIIMCAVFSFSMIVLVGSKKEKLKRNIALSLIPLLVGLGLIMTSFLIMFLA